MSRRVQARPPLLVVVVAVVALAFFALPLAGILERTDWANLWTDLRSRDASEALRLSLASSLTSAALAVLFGIPLAWALARTEIPGRGLLRGLVLLPMVLPPVVGGVALLQVFSLDSPIGGWFHDTLGIQFTFHFAGVVLAETFVAMPFFVITVEAALRNVDQGYEQVAASLGASRATVFRRVTLPLIGPSVAAGAVLAWARALGEFGATITFAGNIVGRTQTLPLAIYLKFESKPDEAVALSLVLLVVSFVVLASLRDKWLVRA